MLRSLAALVPAVGVILLAASPAPSSAAGTARFFPLSKTSLTRGGLRSLNLNLKNDGGDDDDHIGDPDAYTPQGSGKTKSLTTVSALSATRLSLRGGAPAAEETKPPGPKLQVVFVSAEIAPWSVTGGLGAVSPHSCSSSCCKPMKILSTRIFFTRTLSLGCTFTGLRWSSSCHGQAGPSRHVDCSSL
jgi:hypothetical protein